MPHNLKGVKDDRYCPVKKKGANMKIRITSVELENYKSIADCLRNKGIVSAFEIIDEENDPSKDIMIITIKDKEV